MATEVQNHTEPSLTSLVSGIVNDIQDLVKQQLQLTRREIEEDLRKTKEAASILALGLGIAFLGAIPFCLMLVHLLHWLCLPPGSAADPSHLPLWGCFAIVGGLLTAVGASVAFLGKKKLDTLHPLDHTAHALKENLEWKTTPK